MQNQTQQKLQNTNSGTLETSKSLKTESSTNQTTQPKPTEECVNTLGDLAHKVSMAQLNGIEYLAVSDQVFDYFAKGQQTAFISYGDPTVKLYKKGTLEQIEKDLKKTIFLG